MMLHYRDGYCRYCSTEKEDLRELVFRGNKIKCLSCGEISILIPIGNRTHSYIQGKYD